MAQAAARETSLVETLCDVPNTLCIDDSATLRISGVVEESTTDGPGLRYVVFTQGCPHHCKGCHNPETHDFAGGTFLALRDIVAQCAANPLLSGITFSGGEPFLQAAALGQLAKQIKALGKNIMVYTGYTLEALHHRAKDDPAIAGLLSLTDILVDGPYIESLRDLTLAFRGSSNQRVLDRTALQSVLLALEAKKRL